MWRCLRFEVEVVSTLCMCAICMPFMLLCMVGFDLVFCLLASRLIKSLN